MWRPSSRQRPLTSESRRKDPDRVAARRALDSLMRFKANVRPYKMQNWRTTPRWQLTKFQGRKSNTKWKETLHGNAKPKNETQSRVQVQRWCLNLRPNLTNRKWHDMTWKDLTRRLKGHHFHAKCPVGENDYARREGMPQRQKDDATKAKAENKRVKHRYESK